jgi:CelD/BcsL family acetyltransferase involved in cellulose biosynthesis
MKLDIVQDEAGFSRLEPVWDSLLQHSSWSSVFQSYVWVRQWWKHFGNAGHSQLCILVFSENGDILAIGPLMVMTRTVYGMKLRVLRFIGTSSTRTSHRGLLDRLFAVDNSLGWSDRCDFIIRDTTSFDKIMDVFWSQLLHWNLWDIVDLREIDGRSPLLAYLRKKELPRCRYRSVERTMNPSYWVTVQGQFDKYFATLSRRTKRALHLSKNRIMQCHQPMYKIAADPEQIENVLPVIQHIEHKSWKGQRNMGVFSKAENEQFHRSLALQLAQKRKIEIHYLELDSKPVAYSYNFLFKNIEYLHNTAYDSDFRHLSPSLYLTFRMVENAFDRQLRGLDFCRAHSFFKARFKPTEIPRVWWTLYSRRIAPYVQYLAEFKAKPALKSCLQRIAEPGGNGVSDGSEQTGGK